MNDTHALPSRMRSCCMPVIPALDWATNVRRWSGTAELFPFEDPPPEVRLRCLGEKTAEMVGGATGVSEGFGSKMPSTAVPTSPTKFTRLLSRSASRSRQASSRDWRSRSSRAFRCALSTCPARPSSTEASFPRSSASIEAACLNKSAYPPAKSSSAISTAPRRNTPSSRRRPSTSRATLTKDAAALSSNETPNAYSPNDIPTNC